MQKNDFLTGLATIKKNHVYLYLLTISYIGFALSIKKQINNNFMKALEFQTIIDTLKNIHIPKNYQSILKRRQKIRVILLLNEEQENEEENTWKDITNKQFLSGYSNKDAIYDTL